MLLDVLYCFVVIEGTAPGPTQHLEVRNAYIYLQ